MHAWKNYDSEDLDFDEAPLPPPPLLPPLPPPPPEVEKPQEEVKVDKKDGRNVCFDIF